MQWDKRWKWKAALDNSIHKDTDKLMLLYDVFISMLILLQNFTLNIDILTTCILKQNYLFYKLF